MFQQVKTSVLVAEEILNGGRHVHRFILLVECSDDPDNYSVSADIAKLTVNQNKPLRSTIFDAARCELEDLGNRHKLNKKAFKQTRITS